MSKQDDYERKMRRLAEDARKDRIKSEEERKKVERLIEQQRKNR